MGFVLDDVFRGLFGNNLLIEKEKIPQTSSFPKKCDVFCGAS